jgi:uncharacterized caspase-like protein
MTGRIGMVSRMIFAAFLLAAGLAPAAHAEKRVALVIGNSAYQTVPQLPNSGNDARLMSDTLLSLGFFVVGGGPRLDLDKDGFDAALQEFSKELTGADVALFYYAGHGVETHGLNYLVPVDTHPQDEADVFSQLVSTSDILDGWRNPAPASTSCCSMPAATTRFAIAACVPPPAAWRRCPRRSAP